MISSISQCLRSKKNAWVLVPVIAFLGIIIGIIFQNDPLLVNSGVFGCILSSFVLGALAYVNPKKDIVALLAPLYSLIIFNPWGEFSTGIFMQVLYSLTILVVVLRFRQRFYSDI
ncbi:MAG: hypothetical protein JW931_09780 [Methanomicrobiaceae archaeon]|nr:hypothetical protein [Methanomicrobiaceae archaeon]